MSPGARDPRLITVECVIEGHNTDIRATGPRRSWCIRAILWCAFIFSFWAGPYIAKIILAPTEQRSATTSSAGTGQVAGNETAMEPFVSRASTSSQPTSSKGSGENTSEPLISSVVCVCCLLLCIETI